MKKIAIIAFGHWGSTIPLAKHLTSYNYEVHYYIEQCSTSFSELESTDIKVTNVKWGLNKIKSENLGYLNTYCPSVQFWAIRIFKPLISLRYLSVLSNLINKILIWLICIKLHHNNYDAMILVGKYDLDHFIYYHKYMKCPIITCLHEVCHHMSPNFEKPSKLLNYLFKNKKKIIVHSDNCFKDISNYKDVSINSVNKICFGLFEAWGLHQDDPQLAEQIGSNYALFIGGIDKYKGIGVLTSAIKQLREKGFNYNFVIGGRGKDDCLSDLSELDGVYIINRFLTNAEFVTLLKHSRFVICPYLTMSQSGIPQSALVFGKPIVSSNLEGFKEVVKNKVNGLVFTSQNESELAEAIIRMYDDEVLHRLQNNIDADCNNIPDMNWGNISKQYIRILGI